MGRWQTRKPGVKPEEKKKVKHNKEEKACVCGKMWQFGSVQEIGLQSEVRKKIH